MWSKSCRSLLHAEIWGGNAPWQVVKCEEHAYEGGGLYLKGLQQVTPTG